MRRDTDAASARPTDDAGDLADLAPWQRAIVCTVSAGQQRRLLEHLCRNGRTSCSELEARCDVRSVTSRMAGLLRLGLPIERTLGFEADRRGGTRRATFYEVTGPLRQRDLFELHA